MAETMSDELDVIRGPRGVGFWHPNHDIEQPWHLGYWVFTVHGWMPPGMWDTWALSIVSLADFPNAKPAVLHGPGATFEYIVGAVDPAHKTAAIERGEVVFMRPLNYVEQVKYDKHTTLRAARSIVCAFVDGQLPPEPTGISGARELFRRFALSEEKS